MQNIVDGAFNIDVAGDIEFDEREAAAADVRDIVRAAREQIVDADDLEPPGEKVVAEVGAKETGATGDQDARGST